MSRSAKDGWIGAGIALAEALFMDSLFHNLFMIAWFITALGAAGTVDAAPADRDASRSPRGSASVEHEQKGLEPSLPLAADVADQTLARGLSTEPALAASLVALGCLISWRTRRKLARRGLWSHPGHHL